MKKRIPAENGIPGAHRVFTLAPTEGGRTVFGFLDIPIERLPEFEELAKKNASSVSEEVSAYLFANGLTVTPKNKGGQASKRRALTSSAPVTVDFIAKRTGSHYCTVPFEADETAAVQQIARKGHRSFEQTLLSLIRRGSKVLRKGGAI